MAYAAAPVYVFSAVTSLMWVATLLWCLSPKRGDERWYNVFLLVAATMAWWFGETSAIRLGKYQYSAAFPSFLILPFNGSPASPDYLARKLDALVTLAGVPKVHDCGQTRWSIPFPVVALEACLVFAFLRLSFYRLKNKGFWAAVSAASFSAVVMVTLAAILDPVVSNHTWCGLPGQDPGSHGLFNFEIWHWYTDENYTGYWFGVPTVNYLAWFVGMWSFSFLNRLDDEGPAGIVRRYDHLYQYALAILGLMVALFLIQVPLKIGLDRLLVTPPQFVQRLIASHDISKSAWEFGVVGGLLVLSTFVVWWYGKVHPDPRREWVCTSPPIVVLLLCLAALLLEWGGWLNVVWVLAFVVTSILTGLPLILDRVSARQRAQLRETRDHA
jgi:hypothetical protein